LLTAIVILQVLLGIDLLINSSKEFSFLKVISNLAVFQWLLWPAIYFTDINPGQVLEITIMQVSQEEYFSFAWPATLLLIVGLSYVRLYKVNWQDAIHTIQYKYNSKKYIQLAIAGIVFQIIAPLAPISLRFVLKILSYLAFVGVSGLILKQQKTARDKIILVFLVGSSLLGALKEAMFGEVIFFALLLSLLYVRVNMTSNWYKISLFSILVITGLFIQLIKMPLRLLHEHGKTNLLENLSTLNRNGHVSLNKIKSDAFMGYTIARFNNGAVISFVLDRVPNKIDYANGNTVSSAVLGSFIPRILWPNKEISGKEMYLKYTGLKFGGASYGISQLGESYANFGRKRGIIFMFLLGLTLSIFTKKILKLCAKNPMLILYLPVLFLHTVKVETELNRSLGFLIRMLIVLFVLNAGLKMISQGKYRLY